MKKRIADFMHRMQDDITNTLHALDQGEIREDIWTRKEGGGGRSRVLTGGRLFEKAGVNVSVVHGELSPEAAKNMGGGQTLGAEDLEFYATGLSLVLHPHNPMAPTVHANYRYFERGDGVKDGAWWFGGGSDLTPSYLFEDDVVHFHQVLRDVCDEHAIGDYSRFKQWCDEYFHIHHRNEARGVGGVFFDDLRDENKESCFSFVKDMAAAFLPSYLPILQRRSNLPYDENNKRWQGIRRGRYVEFNLVHDRGTTFGLRTGGRIESILMSLPETARWEYCHEVVKGSKEEEMLNILRRPREWV